MMREKADYSVKELDPAETDRMLEFRNRIFDSIPRDHWDSMGCTAVVATLEGRIRGAIPLQFRDFQLNSWAHIPVVFENAVGVEEGYRSRGIGTAMLDCAAEFIQDRAFALCVYRGGERSDGYRFYRKTGHGDLYYATYLRLPSAAIDPSWSTLCEQVETLPWDAAEKLEEELLSIFAQCYGSYGGFRKRDRGFFKRVISSHVFRKGGARRRAAGWRSARLYLVRQDGEITAYSIANPADMDGCLIYDIASPDEGFLRRLVARMALDARENGEDLRVLANREHPVFELFLDCGFEPERDEPYIMARVVRPDRIFETLSAGSEHRSHLELKAITPHRDVVLNAPEHARFAATLYLKEHQLSRLLFCRMDLESALRTNVVRISPVPEKIIIELSRIFAFSPWVTCRLDYV